MIVSSGIDATLQEQYKQTPMWSSTAVAPSTSSKRSCSGRHTLAAWNGQRSFWTSFLQNSKQNTQQNDMSNISI